MRFFKVGQSVQLNNPNHKLNGRVFEIISYVNHNNVCEYCIENEQNKIYADPIHLVSLTPEQVRLIKECENMGILWAD